MLQLLREKSTGRLLEQRRMALSDADATTVAHLYAAFVPEAAPASGPAAMCAALERLPPHRLREIRRFLALARSAAFGPVTGGAPRSFARMHAGGRERALLALRDHAVPALRTAFQACKRLALFVAYSYDHEGNDLWAQLGYPGPDRGAPEPSDVALVAPQDVASHYDAIVIGSGAGGGVAAALAAQSGRRVLVLEAGPPAHAIARAQREFDAFAELYLDAGLTATEDLSVGILAGACVGGGTTINWSTSLRLHARVAHEWTRAAGGIDFDDSLAPHYAAVAQRLGIAPVFAHNRNNAVLEHAAAALDWSGQAHPRNARGCGRECGYCGFGCAYGRKQSTARTYLSDAVANGAHVVAHARAESLHTAADRVAAVNVMFSGEGGMMRRTISAGTVILAAGSLRTPMLLATAGVRHAALGEHLHLHPATAVIAEFDHDIEPWDGPIQSYLIDEFSDMHDGYGVKLEAVPAHPGLAALASPWEGRDAHAEQMRKLRRCAALLVLARDRGHGSVGTDSVARIRYRLDPFDAQHVRAGIVKAAQAALAAGAFRVRTLHNRPVEIDTQDELDAFRTAVAAAPPGPNRLGLFSAHQMGTARMDADAANGIVDAAGRVHGLRNVIVADASVFPQASGVNPMLTIMALAHRSASAFARSG